ncbi:MAG: DUF1015 domain-containing protein [Coprococcus sp.]|nr:DUF1015 domain-containing protein [Coprococcus sp.]
MATIRSFRAYRPRPDVAGRVAALPYDVYNRQEAEIEVKREPMSFLKVDRAETSFGPEVDTYAPCVYDKAGELLTQMIDDGTYINEQKPVYYIYELIMDGRHQTGLVACASIDDYINGVIKKHENTREDKEIDRIKHVEACNAQTGPIFLAYRSMDVVNTIIDRVKTGEKLYGFTSPDGITHNVWIIDDDNDIETIRAAFDGINEIYIADGHHRSASAVKAGLHKRTANPDYTGQEEFNYFLSVLFPHDQLMIMPYNRVVKDLNGYHKDEYISLVSEKFEVSESDIPVSPANKGEIGMYMDGTWYKLKVKAGVVPTDVVGCLDVSVLQDNVLAPILGIGDPRTDQRIQFVGGIRGLSELERLVDDKMAVAFSMYPTSITELFDIADAGKLMPPKSTWFEPKLRSGIFIHKI